jgi:hypothetical protein
LQTKDTDFQVLKQYQGFLNTKPMIDQLPDSKITAFEFYSVSGIHNLDNFPYNEARVFNVLGKRAEIFFRYYLEHTNRYEEVKHSLQVIDKKNTIGEFDFMCWDTLKEETIHVELVNKIYLYDDSLHQDPDHCWIGPNRRDRFIDKIEKLRSQQFPLLYHPKAESLFEELHINPWKVKQQVAFKAILFLPESCHTRFFTTNLEAVAGYFYSLEEFLNKKWKHHTFFIPKKINWFTDETLHTHWLPYSKILLHLQEFMEKKQSVMFFRRNKKGETHKCFVVWW